MVFRIYQLRLTDSQHALMDSYEYNNDVAFIKAYENATMGAACGVDPDTIVKDAANAELYRHVADVDAPDVMEAIRLSNIPSSPQIGRTGIAPLTGLYRGAVIVDANTNKGYLLYSSKEPKEFSDYARKVLETKTVTRINLGISL